VHRRGATAVGTAVTAPEVIGIRSVTLGGERHEYELRRSERRTLGITVEPTGKLVVTAPSALVVDRIETVLQRRRDWIRNRSREVAFRPPPQPPREWVSGETHRYLGRQYRLRVGRGAESAVRLSGQFFLVSVPDPRDTRRVQRLMERWLLAHARETFTRRIEMLVAKASRLRLTEPPPITVRKLRTRWGSCSASGRILMNVEAVRLPLPCIDYVLLHELCHLREPNHGVRFWRLLDACMPESERWRERLTSMEV
jgi:predicted metal-dependent hydrolase